MCGKYIFFPSSFFYLFLFISFVIIVGIAFKRLTHTDPAEVAGKEFSYTSGFFLKDRLFYESSEVEVYFSLFV